MLHNWSIVEIERWRRKVEAAGYRPIFEWYEKTVSAPPLPKPLIEPPVILPPLPTRDTMRP